MQAADFSKIFENGLAVGVIILLFIVLYLLIKQMIEGNKQNRDDMLKKDSQLIEVINNFNSTVLKLNENYDKNLSNLIDSNNRIENKVDKILDEMHKDTK